MQKMKWDQQQNAFIKHKANKKANVLELNLMDLAPLLVQDISISSNISL